MAKFRVLVHVEGGAEAAIRERMGNSGYVSRGLYRDLQAARASQREGTKTVELVTLRKDGKPSGMHDARKRFNSEQEALDYVKRVRGLNPGKQLRFAIDGKEV